MSNAKTDYVILSPNYTGMVNKKNTAIVIHHMAAPGWTAVKCGESFKSTSRQASSNYGIGDDGMTALYVHESNRSWCTSSYAVDSHSVTIEVANSTGNPDWKISDRAMKSLIKLCADICKRNNIKKLYYDGKNGTLLRHCDFASTGCPGPYIISKTDYICNEVNKILNGSTTTSTANKKETSFKPYIFRVTAGTLNVRKDAGVKYKIAGYIHKGECYTCVEEKEVSGIKWLKLKSGLGWVCGSYTSKV